MSRAPSRAVQPQVAGILACLATIVALGGCHRRSSPPQAPSPSERATTEYGYPSIDERSARRFPGVTIAGTPGGGFLVRIHSGLVGDGEPLYVIDGTPMQIEPSRGITWFKPEDIVRITVLKTPSETAVYGPRGTNGVILITTRQGKTPRT